MRLRLGVAARQLLGLLVEAAALLVGVVELAEGVGDLDPADERLQALDQARLGAVALGERRELDRVVEDEGRLDQVRLDVLGEEHVDELAPAERRRSGSIADRRGELLAGRVGSARSTPVCSRIASRIVTRFQGGVRSIVASVALDLRRPEHRLGDRRRRAVSSRTAASS